MIITKVPLNMLKAPEKNVRIHSAKQIEEFKRSIEMFGQIRPIVCDEAYTIIAGNGLYAALSALGWAEADCYIVSGLSEVEKKKLMLADNRIFSLGVDDLQAFDEILLELPLMTRTITYPATASFLRKAKSRCRGRLKNTAWKKRSSHTPTRNTSPAHRSTHRKASPTASSSRRILEHR